ncbi:hypothetical protein FRC10_011597 [Ceratobasidium sp. 414]|nr:hypothetical protein FRC10_011597 [Ceratobasidium sp. 414]
MGTHGWFAYRYKNKYYRERTTQSGYPSGFGRDFASQIPRNATKREERVRADQLRHYEELADGPEEEGDPCSPDVVDNTAWITGEYDNVEWSYVIDLEVTLFPRRCRQYCLDHRRIRQRRMVLYVVDNTAWITGEYDNVEWSYVIDLDYRAFTVKGQVHFKLDHMPRNPSFSHYFEIDDEDGDETLCLPVPDEYLTTVSYWPDPTFNIGEALGAYNQLAPITVDLEAWVDLVKTIVSDHKKTLAMPDLMSEFGKILLISWQVACAAAPSHVLCPAEATPSSEEARRAIVGHTQWSGRPRIIPYQIGVDVFRYSRPYCWFRGCLVKFCLRLDEDAWLKSEVTLVVEQLRKNGRVSEVGILISSFQLVAVTVDGSEVRRSPAIEFHNAKGDVRDGLLLLIHLLGPTAAVHKIPWKSAPTAIQYGTSSTLPEEVIQNVVRFTDVDTYHFVLPLVSRLVRSMRLARPRIGNFILTRANLDGTYQVLSTQGPGTEIRARLVRKTEKVEPGFLHVFQHHQVGVGGKSKTFEKQMEARRKRKPYESTMVSWNSLVRGKDVPTIRVQVVGGVWGMLAVSEATETE